MVPTSFGEITAGVSWQVREAGSSSLLYSDFGPGNNNPKECKLFPKSVREGSFKELKVQILNTQMNFSFGSFCLSGSLTQGVSLSLFLAKCHHKRDICLHSHKPYMSYSPGFTTQVLELNSVVLGLGRTGRPGAENRVQEHIGLNSDKGTMWGKVILGVSGAWETHKEKMNLEPLHLHVYKIDVR